MTGLKDKKEIMREVLRDVDLGRYPFDEFWFDVGFQKALSLKNSQIKQAEEKLKGEINQKNLYNKCIKISQYSLKTIKEIISKIFKEMIEGEELK